MSLINHAGCIVITGAGEGIGRALAIDFASDGYAVVAVDIDQERLDRLTQDFIGTMGRIFPLKVDVSDPTAVKQLSDEVFNEHGNVQLLVNNAGVESVGYLWEVSVGTWKKVQGVNVDAVFYAIREFVPKMAAQQGQSHIVNVSSVAAFTNSPKNGAYGVSKHAVQALTETLYVECQEKYSNIRVSVVCPAAVDSRIFKDALDEGHGASRESQAELLEMQDYLNNHGISVDEAARRIRAGIDSGDFWITTHPQRFKELAQKRAEFLGNQLSPAPNIAEERL